MVGALCCVEVFFRLTHVLHNFRKNISVTKKRKNIRLPNITLGKTIDKIAPNKNY